MSETNGQIAARIHFAWTGHDKGCSPACAVEIAQMEAALAQARAEGRREGLIEAADIVGDHWNDSRYMVNQRDQSLRSAEILRQRALAKEEKTNE